AADKDPKVLTSTLGLAGVRLSFIDPPLYPNYSRFIEKAFAARAKAYGWRPKKGDSSEERLVRPSLLATVASLAADPALNAEAKALTQKWLDDPNALEAEAVPAVVGAAAYRGDQALYDRMLAELRKSKDDNRRATLIAVMGSFRDPKIERQALGQLLSEEFD